MLRISFGAVLKTPHRCSWFLKAVAGMRLLSFKKLDERNQ